jgi:hypothetical protein
VIQSNPTAARWAFTPIPDFTSMLDPRDRIGERPTTAPHFPHLRHGVHSFTKTHSFDADAASATRFGFAPGANELDLLLTPEGDSSEK